jgi:glycolate oxidase FAD binding subunit
LPRFSDLPGALAKVVGDGHLRAGEDKDAVDGTPVGVVVSPADQEEVSAVLAATAEAGATVVTRGRGTKLSWAAPPAAADVLVDLARLDGVVEYEPGDLVVRVRPALRLAELAGVLRPHGQRLAVDEVVPGSSAGGVIATGLSGPLRLLRGSVRDVLLGVTVARADGVLARSGSRVVKNVAGYDLAKLYTGSFGTLGLITEAIFRLHPLPQRSQWVAVEVTDEAALGSSARAWLASPAEVAALEVRRAAGAAIELVALVEGSEQGAAVRAATLADAVPDARILEGPPSWWGRLPAGDALLKLTAAIAEVPAVLGALRSAAETHDVVVEVSGSAGVGVLYAGVAPESPAPAVAGLVGDVRRACTAAGGAAVVLQAGADVRRLVDEWGPVPALELMRRVKDGFDPEHRLAPGRFVGGI